MIKNIREQQNILQGKTVLLRADFDVPRKNGTLEDDYRIRMSLPTIKFLQEHGAKIIILSKTGRPKAGADAFNGTNPDSLLPATERLGELLSKKVVNCRSRLPDYGIDHIIFFGGDIRKAESVELIKSVPAKDILVLENMRFYEEEKKCDPDFAKKITSLGDIYVDDAFAMVHRSEVTISELPKYMPAFAGLNLEKEIAAMHRILDIKENPFLVLMGGVKISDKIGAIKNLGKDADKILIGGGLANLFLKVKGYEIGKSVCETDKSDLALELLRNFKDKLLLPEDVIAAKVALDGSFENPRIVSADGVNSDEAILDIGPKSILAFANLIKEAQKMVWNGPMGFFENKTFSNGTMSIARIFASKCKGRAYGLVGGGDTLAAIHQAKVEDQIDFISTGGGAMLDFLAGEDLPGVKALQSDMQS